ncbi:hypothetical protein EDC30_109118 [Paucimonas lemoignei]|uniref:Uncharacterized protein n=1 Tax=Paucimonas lemoignei TaxID=29443 RepID=A0A4R3HWP7_PAULE|nr:hypothetical protein EDC30_109118 [Paucimonas lemoignei]
MSFQRFCDWLLAIFIVAVILVTASILDQPVLLAAQ